MSEKKPEKDRKYYYAAITIMLSSAHRLLPDYAFRSLISSVKEYIKALERGDIDGR